MIPNQLHQKKDDYYVDKILVRFEAPRRQEILQDFKYEY
jgi:hypothetical protein